MRENYRKSIASIERLPQFTTMNVIDGQAGIIICSSLIFYSLTIDNILNIIVLLILAAVSIATLTGQNGILTQAQNAKEETIKGKEQEQIDLAVAAIKSNDAYTGDNTLNATNLQTELEKLAGQGTVNVTGEETLEIKFLDTQNTYQVKAIINNKLSEVAKVGDYVNYNISYVNDGHITHGTIKENIGTGWRVAYIDEEQDVVKIIPEGIPLTEQDESDISTLLDNTVALEINLMELKDIEKICEQSELEYEDKSDSYSNDYSVENDILNIIHIGATYRINTIGKDWYGRSGKMYVESGGSGGYIEYFTR